MLNGIDPLLIFHLFPTNESSIRGIQDFLTGLPVVGGFIEDTIGIPLPIYLNRSLTGIQLDNESKAIDVDTEHIQSYDPKVPSRYTQKGLSNLVSINMLAEKDSLLLTVLLAANDLIFEKLIQSTYKISYFHGPTVIIKGLLHGMSTTVGADDSLYRVVLQIQKGGNVKAQQTDIVGKQTALTPNPGVGL